LHVERFATLVGVASGIERALRGVVDGLKEDAKLARAELGESSTLAARMSERAAFAQERLRGVAQAAACPAEEHENRADLVTEVRTIMENHEAWAARRGVHLEYEGSSTLAARTYKQTLRLMLDSLLDHAVLATPRGKNVGLKVERTREGAWISVIDGGPAVPRQSRDALLRNVTDATALGRPGGISLLVAYLAAGRLAGSLVMDETRDGRTCVDAFVPVD
jgi:signal transduction histidine kinase